MHWVKLGPDEFVNLGPGPSWAEVGPNSTVILYVPVAADSKRGLCRLSFNGEKARDLTAALDKAAAGVGASLIADFRDGRVVGPSPLRDVASGLLRGAIVPDDADRPCTREAYAILEAAGSVKTHHDGISLVIFSLNHNGRPPASP